MSKKRCNGEGNITKRKDGRWECSIMVGFQKDGRRRRKSFYGKTRKEALDKMHEFKQKVADGLINLDETPIIQPDILFSEWADTWYEGHKDSISKTTQQSYKYTLVTLKEKIGERPVNSIKAMDIEDLLRTLREEGKSDSYVAKARGMLFQIMNKAEANELIRRNPVACVEKMRANKPMEAKEAFTADEVQRLMHDLPHDKYGDSIRLMLGTGIRMQELLALEPRLIEEDGSVIHIRQAVKTVAGRVEIRPPKSRDSLRDVLVPKGLREIVIGLRSTEDKFIIQSPKKEQLFDPKKYRDKSKDYIEIVGDVRVLTPHSCRHTYVSQMKALGVDLATIQSMVGHADLDMTQHYLHVQSPVKQKAVEAFDQAFFAEKPCSSQIPVSA